MSEFFLSGIIFIVLFLLPLVFLPVIASLVYRLRIRYKHIGLSAEAIDLDRFSFNIFKYVIYLLVIPAIMLVTSVIIGYMNGMSTVLDSMIWLIVAITIAFTWCIYRLVLAVSTKARLEDKIRAQ